MVTAFPCCRGQTGCVGYLLLLQGELPSTAFSPPCSRLHLCRVFVSLYTSGAVRNNLTQFLFLPMCEVQEDLSTQSRSSRDKSRNTIKVWCLLCTPAGQQQLVTLSCFEVQSGVVTCLEAGPEFSASTSRTPWLTQGQSHAPWAHTPALCPPHTVPFADPMELSHF